MSVPKAVFALTDKTQEKRQVVKVFDDGSIHIYPDENEDVLVLTEADIVANPEGVTPTQTLTTIKIGDVYYEVDDGGPISYPVTDVNVNGASVVTGTVANVVVPTVNNGTLTIKQNDETVGTFSANSDSNITVELTDTTYSSLSAAEGGTDVSLVTTGEKYNWNNAQPGFQDGSAVIAFTDDGNTDVIKLKAGISQNSGTISNSSGSDITLAKVAKTGSYTDLTGKPKIFSDVKVGNYTIKADSDTDTLELVAGSNITLTANVGDDKVTIAAEDTKYSAGLGLGLGVGQDPTRFWLKKAGETRVAPISPEDPTLVVDDKTGGIGVYKVFSNDSVQSTTTPISVPSTDLYGVCTDKYGRAFVCIPVPDADEIYSDLYLKDSIIITFIADSYNRSLSFRNLVGLASINWGDGTTNTYSNTTSASHTYTADGKYVCRIYGVTAIGDGDGSTIYGAFQSNYRVESVCIANNISSIGAYAFKNCGDLKFITLPDTITTIGTNAFNYCLSLVDIKIPKGITRIEDNTFYYCRTLTNIDVPDGVVYIDKGAFENCSNLINITLPNTLKEIDNNAFYECDRLVNVYYKGTMAEWDTITISNTGNSCLIGSDRYYLFTNKCSYINIATDNDLWVPGGLSYDGVRYHALRFDSSTNIGRVFVTSSKMVGVGSTAPAYVFCDEEIVVQKVIIGTIFYVLVRPYADTNTAIKLQLLN